MRNIVHFSIIALFFLHPLATVCFAGSEDNPAKQEIINDQSSASTNLEESGVRKEYLAEQKVKMLPSKHGDTIDSYMTNMANIPIAEDFGWKVYAIENGYAVERSILVNNSRTLIYKWKVSNSGEVSPVNDRARSLMK